MIDYELAGGIAIVFAVMYIALRLLARHAFSKLVNAEFEHVLNSDEHKVKGRVQ